MPHCKNVSSENSKQSQVKLKLYNVLIYILWETVNSIWWLCPKFLDNTLAYLLAPPWRFLLLCGREARSQNAVQKWDSDTIWTTSRRRTTVLNQTTENGKTCLLLPACLVLHCNAGQLACYCAVRDKLGIRHFSNCKIVLPLLYGRKKPIGMFQKVMIILLQLGALLLVIASVEYFI